MRDLTLLLCLCTLLAAPAGAQDEKKGGFKINVAVDQKSIDAAIAKGLAYLKTSDSPKTGHVADSDALKLLTYVHGGLPEDDPAVQELIKKCLECPLDRTYTVALVAMCLEEIDRVKYQGRIAQCGQFLLDNIKSNGGFGYGEATAYTMDVPTGSPRRSVASSGGKKTAEPPPPSHEKEKPKVTHTIKLTKRKEGPADRSDHSNGQYAALGMRACHDAGIVFPKEWIEKCRQYWIGSQHPADKAEGGRPSVASGMYGGTPRGWCYNDGQGINECKHGGPAYGSMTAGAIGAVCIFDYMLGKDFRKNKTVADGLAWIETNWSVTENIGPPETAKGSKNGWLLYYLYALERVGMLYDTALIGNKDWYLDGARYLLGSQKPDGSWDESHFKKATWDTCFAILFLKRATRRLVASGAAGK